MKLDVSSILITESQIQERVRELGAQISMDYKTRNLMLLCVLKGAIVFFADLIRCISIPLRCEFIQLASYDDDTAPSQLQTIQGLRTSLNHVDVLIVEDIVDTGHTLNFLVDYVKRLKPESITVCSLLDKPSRRQVPVTIDYIGFKIPNAFVVGYGLDYAQQYRNLPYIAIFEEM